MRATVYARMSSDKQSADSPADPWIRAALDAIADAVVADVLADLRREAEEQQEVHHGPGPD